MWVYAQWGPIIKIKSIIIKEYIYIEQVKIFTRSSYGQTLNYYNLSTYVQGWMQKDFFRSLLIRTFLPIWHARWPTSMFLPIKHAKSSTITFLPIKHAKHAKWLHHAEGNTLLYKNKNVTNPQIHEHPIRQMDSGVKAARFARPSLMLAW